MKQRQCKKCGKVYDLNSENFRLSYNTTKSGERRETYRHTCQTCERAKTANHVYKLTRGISHEDRDRLLEEQGGVCKCCGSPNSGSNKGWHVDHDHKTGVIRGVLCANCNVALGQVNDDINKLYQLINYLQSHE